MPFNILPEEKEPIPPTDVILNDIKNLLQKHVDDHYIEGRTVPVGLISIPEDYQKTIEINLTERYWEKPHKNIPLNQDTVITRSATPLKRLIVFNKGPASIFVHTNLMSGSIESGIEIEEDDSTQIEGASITRLNIRANSEGTTVKMIGIV